jgi:hypothetical protein
MTEAITVHGVSKLDLFTPNRLHPTLPPLTLGAYVCMGNDTLMISTPCVLARKAHVYALLGDQADDTGYLRRRIAAHDRLIRHLDIMHKVSRGKARWIKAYKLTAVGADGEKVPTKLTKSLQTIETREEYVRKALLKEWKAMGLGGQGRSEDTAITIE